MGLVRHGLYRYANGVASLFGDFCCNACAARGLAGPHSKEPT